MRDDYGHEFQRWGVCRRCGCDHGDLKATEPCPGELPDLATEELRPPVLPNGPSRRRRLIEDVALARYVLNYCSAVEGASFGTDDVALGLVRAMRAGVRADEAHPYGHVDDAYVHNPNCGGTCGDVCNG